MIEISPAELAHADQAMSHLSDAISEIAKCHVEMILEQEIPVELCVAGLSKHMYDNYTKQVLSELLAVAVHRLVIGRFK